MGVAYPGFHDYYAEGGAGESYFYIPEHHGRTLDKTLQLADQYKNDLDFLQLATFNDYGEGTVFEPTLENGFAYLVKIQKYTRSNYNESDLRNAYRLFLLRKRYRNNAAALRELDQVFSLLNGARRQQAASLLSQLEKE